GRNTTPKPRARKYSYDAGKALQRVWAISGGHRGKCLHTTMCVLLDLLEAHHELISGQNRYTTTGSRELPTMSPATIDHYLGPGVAKVTIGGIATTRPGIRSGQAFGLGLEHIQKRGSADAHPHARGHLSAAGRAHVAAGKRQSFAPTGRMRRQRRATVMSNTFDIPMSRMFYFLCKEKDRKST